MSIVSADRLSVPTEVSTPRPWQQSMKAALRCPLELVRRLGLAQLESQLVTNSNFPVFVPEEFLARMRPGDPTDPLLRQVLPLNAETKVDPAFTKDPLSEAGLQPAPGVVRKYANRALLIINGSCAVNCRYCFRRSFPYQDAQLSGERWQDALATIARSPEIDEVIFSGGDPLTTVDATLASFAEQVSAIPHIRALRVHSRLPVVIPQRIEDSTINWLTNTGLVTTVVIHANHAHELDAAVANSMNALRSQGIHVLNQAVLLRGVNDTVDALCQLSWRLLEIGVLPYYLHQLDRVQGATHFEVPVARGMSLVKQMRSLMPGYAVPRYAIEEPGQPAKTILA